ncbi:hypothetical protein HDU93_003512 [Gonapodya sp. JEL0774]|nr:hypothetical protein HDU93_003512 [Gonapodya sp. JEL0774]
MASRNTPFTWDATVVQRRLGNVIVLRESILAITPERLPVDAMAKMFDFGNALAVREFQAVAAYVNLLEGFSEDVVMRSVERVVVIGTLLTSEFDDNVIRSVQNVLTRFPTASSLQGNMFLPVNDSNDRDLTLLRKFVPDARLRIVRSVINVGGVLRDTLIATSPWRQIDTVLRNQFFAARKVFPNVDELGALPILWDDVTGEKLTTFSGVSPLSDIRTFHVRISNSQLGAVVNQLPCSEAVADLTNYQNIGDLLSLLPSLRLLVVVEPVRYELMKDVNWPGSSASVLGRF